MRLLFILPLLLSCLLNAQPELPELAITFARNERGRPMKGRFVENAGLRRILSTNRREAWSVQMHFTVSADYPYGDHGIGTHKQWSLSGEPMRKGRRTRVFTILDCTCTNQYLLIAQGEELMRIDVPEGPERVRVKELILELGRTAATIHFRHGRFALADLVSEEGARRKFRSGLDIPSSFLVGPRSYARRN